MLLIYITISKKTIFFFEIIYIYESVILTPFVGLRESADHCYAVIRVFYCLLSFYSSPFCHSLRRSSSHSPHCAANVLCSILAISSIASFTLMSSRIFTTSVFGGTGFDISVSFYFLWLLVSFRWTLNWPLLFIQFFCEETYFSYATFRTRLFPFLSPLLFRA